VKAERAVIISELLKKLKKKETAILIDATVAYRLGKITHTDFYIFIQDLCEKNGLNLKKFKAMGDYLQYILLSESIAGDQLQNEIRNLERSVYNDLAKTNQERDLLLKSRHLYLIEKLLNFALTTEEWREYREGYEDIRRYIRRSLIDGKIDLSSHEAFYQQAEHRDRKMAQNLMNAVKNKNTKFTILVTGGFHSRGIQNRLLDLEATIISFTPKITKVEQNKGTSYLSIFTQEKTPLEKLFEGETLFLAHHPLPKRVMGQAYAMVAVEAFRIKSIRVPTLKKMIQSKLNWNQVTFKRIGKKAIHLIKDKKQRIEISYDKNGDFSSIGLGWSFVSIFKVIIPILGTALLIFENWNTLIPGATFFSHGIKKGIKRRNLVLFRLDAIRLLVKEEIQQKRGPYITNEKTWGNIMGIRLYLKKALDQWQKKHLAQVRKARKKYGKPISDAEAMKILGLRENLYGSYSVKHKNPKDNPTGIFIGPIIYFLHKKIRQLSLKPNSVLFEILNLYAKDYVLRRPHKARLLGLLGVIFEGGVAIILLSIPTYGIYIGGSFLALLFLTHLGLDYLHPQRKARPPPGWMQASRFFIFASYLAFSPLLSVPIAYSILPLVMHLTYDAYIFWRHKFPRHYKNQYFLGGVAFLLILIASGFVISNRYVLHDQKLNIFFVWIVTYFIGFLFSLLVSIFKPGDQNRENNLGGKKSRTRWLFLNLTSADFGFYQKLPHIDKSLIWGIFTIRYVFLVFFSYQAFASGLSLPVFIIISTIGQIVSLILGSIIFGYFLENEPDKPEKKNFLAIPFLLLTLVVIFYQAVTEYPGGNLFQNLWILGLLPAIFNALFEIPYFLGRKYQIGFRFKDQEEIKRKLPYLITQISFAFSWIIPFFVIFTFGMLDSRGIEVPFFLSHFSQEALEIIKSGFNSLSPLSSWIITLNILFIGLARYGTMFLINWLQKDHHFKNQTALRIASPVINWIMIFLILGETLEGWQIVAGFTIMIALLFLYQGNSNKTKSANQKLKLFIKKNHWEPKDWEMVIQILKDQKIKTSPRMTKKLFLKAMRLKEKEIKEIAAIMLVLGDKNEKDISSLSDPRFKPLIDLGTRILRVEALRWEERRPELKKKDENRIIWKVPTPKTLEDSSFLGLVSHKGRLVFMNGGQHFWPGTIFYAVLQREMVKKEPSQFMVFQEKRMGFLDSAVWPTHGEFKIIGDIVSSQETPNYYGPTLYSGEVLRSILKRSKFPPKEILATVFLDVFGRLEPQFTGDEPLIQSILQLSSELKMDPQKLAEIIFPVYQLSWVHHNKKKLNRK